MKRFFIYFSLLICFIFGNINEINAQYHYYYNGRGGCYHYYPRTRVQYVRPTVNRTIVVAPRQEEVIYVEQPTRTKIVHVDDVEKEIVYVHKKKEREYRIVEDNNEINYDYERYDNNVQYTESLNIRKEEPFEYSDMWQMPIHFKRDSYKLSYENGEMNLHEVIKFLHDNPSATISLFSYADIETGDYYYNKHLAKRRMETVVKWLTNRGISENRLTKHIIGTDDQYYDKNKWNRCVIIRAD